MKKTRKNVVQVEEPTSLLDVSNLTNPCKSLLNPFKTTRNSLIPSKQNSRNADFGIQLFQTNKQKKHRPSPTFTLASPHSNPRLRQRKSILEAHLTADHPRIHGSKALHANGPPGAVLAPSGCRFSWGDGQVFLSAKSVLVEFMLDHQVMRDSVLH